MRKSLVFLFALTLVFGVTFGAAACCFSADPVNQNVRVRAPFLLEASHTGNVNFVFGMDDYERGYIRKNNQLFLKVGAPDNWDIGASVNNNGSGVANALKATAGQGWIDLETWTKNIRSGVNGVTSFWIDYMVEMEDLNSNCDIDHTVTVTYNFI